MSEETMKENKAIRILFQKLTDEKYKQRECKNVFIISVVPKGFKNSKYDEFEKKLNQVIYVSATPGDLELEHTNNHYVEQIIRPTGLLDPTIEVRKTEGQIDDLIGEII